MPRRGRRAAGGVIYHVLNRGNGRSTIFHKDGDYQAFLKVLAQAQERVGMDVLAYCLMPNHWHLVLRPRRPGDLARFIGWLCTTHVRRYHEHYHSRGGGHVYQGRFKSFAVQEDRHLLTVLRYVEANARRAKLTERAERWRWGSAGARAAGSGPVTLTDWPVERPANWLERLNEEGSHEELTAVRASLQRGWPFGAGEWVAAMAKRLGVSLRGPGRPKMAKARKDE